MVYHTLKQDTDKIVSLNSLCDYIIDETWSKYQFVQYELIGLAMIKYKDYEIIKKLRRIY